MSLQSPKLPRKSKSTNVRIRLVVQALFQKWLKRRRQRRQLASFDTRSLADLGINAGLADFEAEQKPWGEETGLGKDSEIGTDCAPRQQMLSRSSSVQTNGSPKMVRIAGRPIGLRPVLPEDKGLLREFMDALSERSRRLRFLTIKHRLSNRELIRLTEVDQQTHVAWVAVDLSSHEEQVLGEACFVQLPDELGVAEYGVTVADTMQGQGLGRLIMDVLANEAKRCGVKTLRGFISEDNALMLSFVSHRGGKMVRDYPGVMKVDLPIAALLPVALAAE